MSEYHEHMGKLRHIFFSMTVNAGKKATNESIIPISIAHHHIMTALNSAHSVRENLGENSGFSGKRSVIAFGKETQQSQIIRALQAILTTCQNYR